MSKKMFKKSLALGALMAFVITGSAMAASVEVSSNVTQDSISTINVVAGESFNNEGTVIAKESVKIDNAVFNNTGTIETKVFDFYNRYTYAPKYGAVDKTIGGDITATDKFIYRGLGKENCLAANLITKTLHIIAEHTDDYPLTSNDTSKVYHSVGLVIKDGNVLDKVGEVIIDGRDSQAALVIHGDANVEYDKTIYLKSDSENEKGKAFIEIYNKSSLALENLVVDGPEGKIQSSFNKDELDKLGNISINNLEIEKDSSLELCNYAAKDVSGLDSTFIFNEITIADNGSMYANVNGNTQPKLNIEGDIKMNLGSNAVVDFGGNKYADWRGDKVSVDATAMEIKVADNTSRVYLSTEGSLEDKNISVIASGENNTGNAANDLAGLAKIVNRVDDSAEGGSGVPTVAAVDGVQLTQEASNIFDAATGTVAQDGTVKDMSITKNSNTYGITENNSLSLMSWRAEMNDMNKRMGELRNAEGQHGVWVRMVRGEAEYESVKNQYNQYQIGYDEKLSTDPSWTVGAAFNYTEGDTSYSSGSAENKNTGFSIYGSKLNDDGSFIDLIAKYARLENDFETNIGSGDYASNGYSVSAEFGKRRQQGKGLWIEPQVELTYGKVGSADYRMGTVDVAQDSIESLAGRVGFSVGKDISKGNVYARASYLYDFDGETAVRFVDGGKPRTMEQDLGGGWWEVGVGANINLSKATYIYADVEKTFGGEVDTNWQWNLGVRYSF